MSSIISVKNLNKSYKTIKAVDSVSFDIIEGEIFGILGPNGAGKSTTLEIIEGLRTADDGEIDINGLDATKKNNRVEIQEMIGVQLQSSSYFDKLTLFEILDLFGSMYSKRLEPLKLLSMVGLDSKKNELVKNLSGGQAQRFSIVAAIVNDPQIVFLDEPTTGLDPNIRRELWDLIKKINKQGKTIILTTHYMEEAEELCDRIGIMNDGKLIALDTPQDLIHKQKLKFTIKFVPVEKLQKYQEEDIETNESVIDIWEEKEKVGLTIDNPASVNNLLNWLEEKNVVFKNLEIIPPNLEDVFIKLTGKSLKK